MTRSLPPLNALRAFEAAARHLSFSKAADELNVTPAAISHQIKGLEAQIGVPLFRRLTRALLLTDAGQAALPPLREGFDRLAEAADRMRSHQNERGLTVSVAPSIAAKWLVPRLDRFQRAHPDIDIRLDATNVVADFARDGIDISVRYGSGDYPGLRVDEMFSDAVVPVCNKRFLEGEHPLRAPADLRHHTLLHTDWSGQGSTWPDWRMWLLAAGVSDIDPDRGPKFAQEALAIQAAVEGHGIALGSTIWITDDLIAGRLVAPFDLTLPSRFAYYVCAPAATADRPKVVAFRDWLLAEARAERGADAIPDSSSVGPP